MASKDLRIKLNNLKSDIFIVETDQNFSQIKNNPALYTPWSSARDLSSKWLSRVEPVLGNIDNESLQPLVELMEKMIAFGQNQGILQDGSFALAVGRTKLEFFSSLPLLIYGLMEARGLADISADDFLNKRAAA